MLQVGFRPRMGSSIFKGVELLEISSKKKQEIQPQ